MSNAAGRKLKTTAEQTPPATEKTKTPAANSAAKMTVRQYAVACLEWHIDDWEKANERTIKGSRWAKESAFFFMRLMKGHPKLISTPPEVAAETFAALFAHEPTVQDYFLSEGMGLDDVVTYVHSRWSKIRVLSGMSPLDVAVEQAKADNGLKVLWCGLPFDVTKKHYAQFLQDKKPPTWENLHAYFQQKAGTGLRTESILLRDLGVLTPSEGLFLAALWKLHLWLSKSAGTHPLTARPPMILSCDALGPVLGVSSKTAWTYRTRLENDAVIVKLPRQGPADRFELDPLLFGTWVFSGQRKVSGSVTTFADGRQRRTDKIDLD